MPMHMNDPMPEPVEIVPAEDQRGQDQPAMLKDPEEGGAQGTEPAIPEDELGANEGAGESVEEGESADAEVAELPDEPKPEDSGVAVDGVAVAEEDQAGTF